MPEQLQNRTRGDRLRTMIATERFRWWLVFVVLEMIAAVRAATPIERDHLWSARAGLENLHGAPLIRPDTWSWSTHGEWVPNSPVWNIVLGLGWQTLGFWGLFWVAFLSITAFFALALLLARLAGARAFPTLIGFAPVLLFGFSAFTPRATMVVQSLLFLAVLFAWWWGGRAARAGWPAGIAFVGGAGVLLSAVGNWVHLSFMFMSATVAVIWAVAWFASPGISTVRRLGLVTAGTLGLLAGCVVSPYGIAMTIERSRVVAEVCRGLVSEWLSLAEVFQMQGVRFVPFILVAVVLASASLMWAVRLLRRGARFESRFRIIGPLVVIGVPLVAFGFGSIRFILVGLLLLMPVLAGIASALISRLHRFQRRSGGILSRPRAIEYTSGGFWTVILSGLIVLAIPLVVSNVARGGVPPEAAVVRAIPSECNVWPADTTAGATILLRPDTKVWADGRADFYGRAHLLEYLRIMAGTSPIPAGADCVVLPINDVTQQLRQSLDADDAWRRSLTEAGYALWERR